MVQDLFEKPTKMSQEEQIAEYLKAGHSLTPMGALHLFNCWALSSRVADLRKKGINIESRLEKSEGKTYSRYFIREAVATGA